MARQGAVRVSITGDNSGLRRELQQSERGLNTFAKKSSKHFTSVGKGAAGASKNMAKLAGAASAVGAGYLAIAEAKEAINVTVELGKATKSLNANLGIGVKESSEWAAVAKVRGIESKQLAQAFGTLAKQERQAGEGAKSSVQAFKDLGLSQKELKNQDFNTTLGEVADGLGNLKGGADKTAISMKLFGRGWQTVVPVLREGSKAMQEQLHLAEKYGVTFSGKTLRSTTDLVKAQRELKFATLGLQLAFGTQLAPALTKILPKIAQFLNQMRLGKGPGGEFRQTIEQIVRVIKQAAPVVGDLLRLIGKLTPAFKLIKFTSIGLMQMAFKNLLSLIPKVGRLFAWLGTTIANKFGRVFGNVMATVIRGFGKLFQLASHLPGVGGKFGKLAQDADHFADKVDRIGEKAKTSKSSLQSLTSKTWPVNVSLKVGATSGVNGLKPFQSIESLTPHGDPGMGIERYVARGMAQEGTNYANSHFIQSNLGSMPGGKVGGTLKKAWDVANRFGLTVGSTYRDPSHNAAVGGVPGSLHTHGSFSNPGATDLNGPVGSLYRASVYARNKYHPVEDLVHDAGSGLHLHLGWFAKGGTAFKKQMAVVGEEGPELVSLPQGAEVHSHTKSRSMVARVAGAVPGFAQGGMVRASKAARAAGFKGRGLQVALAVAAAESGNFTDLIGDESLGGSYGPWQVHHPSHPEYNIRRLQTDWTYAAKAAYAISDGGRNWAPWTTYRTGVYQSWLGEAAATIRGGGGAAMPKKKGPSKAKQRAAARKAKRAQKRKDKISMGSFAHRLAAQGHDPWTGAFAAQMDNALALAELTPGTADDRAAQVQALQGWLGFLDAGKRSGNQSLITAGAQGVKGAIDAIKSIDEELSGGGGGNSLADALTDLVEATKANTEEVKSRNAYAASLANTSKEVAVQALADVISGQIGGKTSQRRRSAGDGVTVARY